MSVAAIVLKLPNVNVVIFIKNLALHKVAVLEQALKNVPFSICLLALAVALVVTILACAVVPVNIGVCM
jgi:hypothetical protein